MKTIRILLAGLMLWTCVGASAQVTNAVVSTNGGAGTNVVVSDNPVVDNEGEAKTIVFPQDRGAIWLALIPPITSFITWMLGKIPKLPNQFLPWLTPVGGILIGAVLDWANQANLAWWEAGAAGTVAVFLYEGIKNVATTQGQPSMLKPVSDPANTSTPLRSSSGYGQR